MALGSLTLGDDNVGFDAEGTAMVPISSGDSKIGEIKIKSPLETFKDTFTNMTRKSRRNGRIQTKKRKDKNLLIRNC